jgi:hypothetical protein
LSAEEHYGKLLKHSLSIIHDEQQPSFTERNNLKLTQGRSLSQTAMSKENDSMVAKRQTAMMVKFEIGRQSKNKNPKKTVKSKRM